MQLTLDSILTQADAWKAAHVALPKFDIATMRAQTKAAPEWVHFGAGNIFRGFIGSLNQRLLDAGLAKTSRPRRGRRPRSGSRRRACGSSARRAS